MMGTAVLMSARFSEWSRLHAFDRDESSRATQLLACLQRLRMLRLAVGRWRLRIERRFRLIRDQWISSANFDAITNHESRITNRESVNYTRQRGDRFHFFLEPSGLAA